MEEESFQALLDAGLSTQEAERIARLIVERQQNGVDPGRVLNEAEMAEMADVSQEDIDAARAEWYASRAVPAKFKRLLDAREL